MHNVVRFIYIVKSSSINLLLTVYPHLHKLRFTNVGSAKRLYNAENQTVFFEAIVKLVFEKKCFNSKQFELTIHSFLAEECLVVQVKSRKTGKCSFPKEWYKWYLDIIEETIQLCIDDKIHLYTLVNKRIIKKILILLLTQNPAVEIILSVDNHISPLGK